MAGPHDNARWWSLSGFCLVLFASISFKSMVGIAIPELQEDLEASLAQVQWLLNAYTLMLAALLLTAGALADRYGRRRVYRAGLLVFATGALLCLLAPTATFLDLASGVMGVGGALVFPAGVALLGQLFTGPDRATAFGVFGTTVALGVAVGPLLGGILIELAGWRGVFALLALLAVSGIATDTWRGADDDQPVPSGRSVDWVGPLAFSGMIFLLNFVLIRGHDEGFTSGVIVGAGLLSAVLLGVFILSQQRARAARAGREPMLDLALLRNRSVTGAAIAGFCGGFVAFGLAFYSAIYLGRVLGNSPVETGLKLLPLTAVAFAVSPLAGTLMRRVPARALLGTALALMGAGVFLLRGLDAGSEWHALVIGFVIVGLGSGLLTPPLIATAVSVVPAGQAALAGGINNTARQLGIAFGVAGLGALFQARISEHLAAVGGVVADRAARDVAGGQFAAAVASAPASVRETMQSEVPVAFFAGVDDVFLLVAVVAAVGAVAAATLVRSRDFVVPAGGSDKS